MPYASGNCTQIVLFSTLAIQLKRRAPSVHTYLELVRIRFGTFPHLTYIFFALATNILVCSSVLLGGAAAINSITGMNVYAALWLLPLTVIAYTLRGGLRSTILADYLHTVIIFAILFIFWLRAYATFPEIGSPSAMYDLLVNASKNISIDGNYDGSPLTLKTEGGQYFTWLSALEYTGVVFLDASFHQKGVAAMPEAAFPGYLIGGLAWFSIPFCLATTAGLAALALETTYPGFPTYPNRVPKADVSAGLVLPYAAQALLGKGGSAAVLLLMFMSCTSAISAQMIGVSTVVSYDIFKTYFKPTITPEKLLRANQYVVVGFGLFAAAFGSMLHGIGLDLGFIYVGTKFERQKNNDQHTLTLHAFPRLYTAELHGHLHRGRSLPTDLHLLRHEVASSSCFPRYLDQFRVWRCCLAHGRMAPLWRCQLGKRWWCRALFGRYWYGYRSRPGAVCAFSALLPPRLCLEQDSRDSRAAEQGADPASC